MIIFLNIIVIITTKIASSYRKGKTEIGDRSGWTETPEDKERRARGEEVEGGNQEEEERERTQYLLNKARFVLLFKHYLLMSYLLC